MTATQTFTITVLACEIKERDYSEVVDISITPSFPFYALVTDISTAEISFPNPATTPIDYIIHDQPFYMNLKNYVFKPKCDYIAEYSLAVALTDGTPVTVADRWAGWEPFYPYDANPS